MGLLEEMKTMGISVDEALVDRFMRNASLYERMLKKFPAMIKDLTVQPDFDGNDYTDIIEKAHAIKGATGNLSIDPLYKPYTEIVNLLREGKPEEAREVLKKVLPVQDEIVQCIEKYM